MHARIYWHKRRRGEAFNPLWVLVHYSISVDPRTGGWMAYFVAPFSLFGFCAQKNFNDRETWRICSSLDIYFLPRLRRREGEGWMRKHWRWIFSDTPMEAYGH